MYRYFVAFVALLVFACVAPAANAAVTVTKNVVFTTVLVDPLPGSPAGTPKRSISLHLDVNRPASTTALPAVILIHGGGFVTGHKDGSAALAALLADQGFVVFNINYRLACGTTPSQLFYSATATLNGMCGARAMTIVQDVQTAVRWVRANASKYGANPLRVGALGTSAGGHLASTVGTRGLAGAEKVDAVVAWSPPLDLLLNTTTGPYLNYTALMGCAYAICPGNWWAASPYNNVTRDDAPMYIANSESEFIPILGARNMDTKLQGLGVSSTLRVLPGRLHAVEYQDQVFAETAAWLHSKLG